MVLPTVMIGLPAVMAKSFLSTRETFRVRDPLPDFTSEVLPLMGAPVKE